MNIWSEIKSTKDKQIRSRRDPNRHLQPRQTHCLLISCFLLSSSPSFLSFFQPLLLLYLMFPSCPLFVSFTSTLLPLCASVSCFLLFLCLLLLLPASFLSTTSSFCFLFPSLSFHLCCSLFSSSFPSCFLHFLFSVYLTGVPGLNLRRWISLCGLIGSSWTLLTQLCRQRNISAPVKQTQRDDLAAIKYTCGSKTSCRGNPESERKTTRPLWTYTTVPNIKYIIHSI